MAATKKPGESDDENTNLPPEIVDALLVLQKKVLSSPALNGGFDAMMVKVEMIEEGQQKMGIKVDSIHDAIYHPDEGLYSRIKAVEVEKTQTLSGVQKLLTNVDKLEKDVAQIQFEQTNNKKSSQLTEDNDKVIKELSQKVSDLTEFKLKVMSVLKWSLVTIGGGIIGGIGKLIYDFAQGHISFH